MTVVATGWAVVRPDGTIVVECGPSWELFLPSDVEEAKSRGARAFRCEVREIGEEI